MWSHWTPRRKILCLAVLILAIGAAVVWAVTRPEPPDTRFTSAYRLDDGRLAIITPREGKTLRLRFPESGESLPLFPVGAPEELRYEAGTGWSERQPVTAEVTFTADGGASGEDGAHVQGFRLVDRVGDGEDHSARRIDLPEVRLTIESGDLRLRGKLVLPTTHGPHPAVVLVHGSEAYSGVDFYAAPYLFAPNGIATLVFDKRGTGGSDGSYSQNFHVLARDVVAAVDALRERPEIDPARIHLQGGSQGGWIAPLAAAEDGRIKSLLIDYGPMVPIAEEDRWGYVYQLRRKGLGDEALQQADRLNATVNRAIRGEEGAWDELGSALDAARGTPWLEAAKGSDSMIGFLAETRMPLWVMRLYAWWKLRPVDGAPFAERFYDPVPTVAGLDVPSLWIFGGEDHSMPTYWSIDRLVPLRAAGRPVEILLYPEADHGILRFDEAEDGTRRMLGYEPGYMATQVAWLRFQSGLDDSFEPTVRSRRRAPGVRRGGPGEG